MPRKVPSNVVIGLLAGILALPSAAVAGSVTLTWDPNPESNVSYIIGYGTQPGAPTLSIDVGSQRTGTIGNLVEGQRYYFVVFAHVLTAISPASNEVSVVIPVSAPAPAPAPAPTPSLTPSLSGTRTPPASQIVDATLAVWTIGTGAQILRNGAWTGQGMGSQILWYQGTLYALGIDSKWWRWTGSGWELLGPDDPAGAVSPLTPSPSGTRTPPASQIVDDALAVWTIATGAQILRNGAWTGQGMGSQILWYQGALYALGIDAKWWRWTGSCWALFGPDDPAGAVTPSGPSRVVVTTVGELQSAVDSLTSNTTVVIQPGTYRLTKGLLIGNGVTNVAIEGATTNRDDAVIYGSGMNTSGVNIGLTIENAQSVRIANLSIGETFWHAIQLQGDAGADRINIENVRLFDSGRQLLASTVNAQNQNGVDDVVVERSLIEYSIIGPSSGNTEGISVHHGARWTIRRNLFRNIHVPAAASIKNRPAILMQSGSRDTIVDNNVFVNCERGIVFGVGPQTGYTNSHVGGAIYNNLIWRTEPMNAHVGISVADSPGTQVLHNTIMQNGTYADAVEYRYLSTAGITIANNLTDGAVRQRDGAQGSVAGNFTQATLSMFVNAAAGDLHLAPGAWQAIDQGVSLAEVTTDWEGDPRPFGLAPDLGADEVLIVNQPPVAVALASVASGTAPLTVAFSSNGSMDPEGQPLSFVWDFGDGATSAGANPSHIYTATGTFVATLSVKDAAGATSASKVTIGVTAPASLTAPTDLRATANKAVSLTWTDRASGEAGYIVERAVVSSSQVSYSRIAVLAAGATTFKDVNVDRRTTYRYRVAPSDVSGTPSGYSNSVDIRTK